MREKMKLQKKQFKTVRDYMYHPDLHGTLEEFTREMLETFELVDSPKTMRKKREMQRTLQRKKQLKVLPPPIPKEAFSQEDEDTFIPPVNRPKEYKISRYHGLTIHRGTPKLRTLCGSRGIDVVTTMEDQYVTCSNCLLPGYQMKLNGETSTIGRSN